MIVLSFLIYAIMFILEKIYDKDHPEKEPKKSTYDVEFYKKGEHPKHIRA